MGAKLIAFECRAADHHGNGEHSDQLTIHEGAWAFCPFDSTAAGHEWHATGGADVDALRRHGGGIAIAPTPLRVDTARLK